MKDHHSRKVDIPDARHIRAADDVIAQVCVAVRAVDELERTTGKRAEIEFHDRETRRRDAFEVRFVWFLIGAVMTACWYIATIKLSGWI